MTAHDVSPLHRAAPPAAPTWTPAPAGRPPSRANGVALAAAVLAGALLAGYAVAAWSAPILHDRQLPWIAGRGLGVAAYLSLVGATALGLWLRHPWRHRFRALAPATCLRLHLTLVASTAVLTGAHLTAVAMDRYAHVGWTGALVPGQAAYRTLAVALGTAGLYLGVLVSLTAAFAGRLFGRVWLPIHRLSTACFALVWTHGVLAGSDVLSLRPLYIATGLGLVLLTASRRLATDPVQPADRAPRPDALAAGRRNLS